MNRAAIPEWFIGGPMHGKDRLIEVPDLQRDLFAVPQTVVVRQDDDGLLSDGRLTPERQHVYARRKFAIGRTVLVIWVVAGMRDLDVGDRLAEVLLAPHRDSGAE